MNNVIKHEHGFAFLYETKKYSTVFGLLLFPTLGTFPQ